VAIHPPPGTLFSSLLGLRQAGTTARSFAEDKLAPLIRPEMSVYQGLRHDIFGA